MSSPRRDSRCSTLALIGGRIIAQYVKDAYSVVTRQRSQGQASVRREVARIRSGGGIRGEVEGSGNVLSLHRFPDAGVDFATRCCDRQGGCVPRVKDRGGHETVRHRTGLLPQQGWHTRPDVHHASARSGEGRPGAADAVWLWRFQYRPAAGLQRAGTWCGWRWAVSMRSPICAAGRSTARHGTAPVRGSQKQNVFDDFIAAAEWLVAEKYTSTPKLAIRGRSNGGLLVGAVLTQRPDLFGAALPAVGVLDMLRYHTASANARQWSTDYGLSEDAAEFKAQYAYSPVHNVKHGHVLSADAGDDRRSRRSRRAMAQLQVRGGAAARAGMSESQSCCASKPVPVTARASPCGCRSKTSPTSGHSWCSHCRWSRAMVRLKAADVGDFPRRGRIPSLPGSSVRLVASSTISPSRVSPGIACFSAAHAPRSMSLQRSVQNGRHGEASDHSTGRLQVGQGTEGMRKGTGYGALGVRARTGAQDCAG